MSSNLLQVFEEVLIRINSGETLVQALDECPTIFTDQQEAQRWHKIKNSILDGKIPSLSAMESYVDMLRREQRLRMIWKRKGQGPRLQIIGVVLSGALFFLAGLLIFPDELKPDTTVYILYLLLSSMSIFWMKSLLSQWRTFAILGEWLPFLCEIKQGLLCGYTFQTIKRSQAIAKNSNVLLKLKNSLINEQWKTINRLDEMGKPLSAFLSACIDQYQRYYENRIEEEAERLQYKLLAPLLLLQLPAQLSIILLPLLKMISQS